MLIGRIIKCAKAAGRTCAKVGGVRLSDSGHTEYLGYSLSKNRYPHAALCDGRLVSWYLEVPGLHCRE